MARVQSFSHLLAKAAAVAGRHLEGRLAIEEYEKEKRRKREEKEKERTTTTTPRGYRTHPAVARTRFSDDQLGASAGDE